MSSHKTAGKKLGVFLVVALLLAFVMGWFYINTKGVESVAGVVKNLA